MKSHPIKFFSDHQIIPREQQREVLNELHANWTKHNYFALSLPTGVGKTYIATSIADSVDSAYILTSTLQLQTQYEKSWDELVNLKGRGNYTCNLNNNFTVDAAPCTANPALFKECRKGAVCSYYNQKDAAMASKAMITNPVYMLYSTHCGFAKEDGDGWTKRSVLIIDEAHNLENHLIQFAESDVDPQKYHDEFGVDTAGIVFTGNTADDYTKVVAINDILQSKARELASKLENEFPNVAHGTDLKAWAKGFTDKVGEKVKKLNARIYALDKAIQPLKIFFNTHSTPHELTERWIISKHFDKNALKLAPIYGDFLFHEYLGKLADKFVFLSATLGTKKEFCREIGIETDKCMFLETGSPFDPMKSPVIVMPSIKLSKDVYEKNVQRVGGIIDSVLEMHEGQRGIIHSTTYDLAKNIYQRVKKSSRERLLCRDMDVLDNVDQGKNKYPKRYKNDELLSIHETEGSGYGSVLLSPSMMEGVDLHDDLSQFQVIIKLPWANLGDVRVKVKSTLDGDWYQNKMWLSILQASGRSTRHEEDTSVTYCLDEKFPYFYKQWEHKLPSWFKLRLVF